MIQKIIKAIERFDNEELKSLLSQIDSHELNSSSQSPLHTAVKNENEYALFSLLRLKINVNLPNDIYDRPIHEAVFRNNIDMVKILLYFKADPNLQNLDGELPKCIAEHKGNKPICTLLNDGLSKADEILIKRKENAYTQFSKEP